MSTRTVIEINHDYLHDLLEHPEGMVQLLRALRQTQRYAETQTPPGVRILGQRHHSETLELSIR
jgi:hypothetical protein